MSSKKIAGLAPRAARGAAAKAAAVAPAPAEFWFGRYSTSMDGDTFVTVGRTANEVRKALVEHIREHAQLFPEWRHAGRVERASDTEIAEFFGFEQPERLGFGSVMSV